MSDTLFDISQYQSHAHISYSPDWRDATGTDPAWEQPDRELDLGANSQSPDCDAPTGWRGASEFTLTLQSGQDVEVTFVPGLVGDRRMHEFSFTGPVSTTGFKSHFVLAAESEQFPHPRDYAQAYAQEIVAQHQEKLKKAKSTKRAHQHMTNEQDDCGNSAIPVKAVEVLPQVMTEAEARQCIAAIKGDVVSIRTRLVDLEERRGFEALGYPNISACMEAEFQ